MNNYDQSWTFTSTKAIEAQKPAKTDCWDKDTPTQNSKIPDLGTLRTQLAADDDLHTLGTVLHDESEQGHRYMTWI